MNEAPIEVLLGFDMETDVGSWTPFHEELRHATPPLLDLFAKHAITGTFYFFGASAREVPESVRAVQEAGHEVGAHSLYHETVGEPIFPIPGVVPLLEHEVTRRLEPYHPDPESWTEAGEMRLVEIPNFADLSIQSEDPYGRDRDQWPLFRTASAQALLERIDRYLQYLKDRGTKRRVLAFYFHPWKFWPMSNGLISYGEGAVKPDSFIVKNCGDYALAQLDILIQELLERGAIFKTAREIARDTLPSS